MQVEHLEKLSGDSILNWVNTNLESAPHFNWLLLAEISSSRALLNNDGQVELDEGWLKAGIKIYEFLSEKNIATSSFLQQAMRMRVSLILYSSNLDEINSIVDILEHWFLESLTCSFDEARLYVDSCSLENMDLEKLIELRNIKTNLRILEPIYKQDGGYKLTDSINIWFQLLEELP